MTRHHEQDWSDYTCPHCGQSVWDTDYSHSDSYSEDDWFVEEITCGCGAEITFSRRIADFPSYVSWDDTHCEPNEEQATESDIVSRPPVDNSPIGQSRACIAQLHADIVAVRAQRDLALNAIDSSLPDGRNNKRMSPELIQQWRQHEKQYKYLEFEEKIEELCIQLRREQELLEQLEKAETDKLEEAASPVLMKKDLTMVYNKLVSGVPLL